MGRLGNDAFLTQLVRMYEASAQSGSVVLCVKRVRVRRPAAAEGADPNVTTKGGDPNAETRVLVRATSTAGRGAKASTLVCARDQPRFQAMLGNIVKAHTEEMKTARAVAGGARRQHASM